MKIEINDIEFKNKQHEIAVLLTHPKKETILILSKNLPSSATYLEYNDQSNAVYDGITEINVNGNNLSICLNEKCIQKIGHKTIQVKLSLDETDYKIFLQNIKEIFDKCLRLSNKPFAYIKSREVDYTPIKYLNLDGKNLTSPPENLIKHIALEKLFIRDNPNLDVHATMAILAKLPNLRQLQINMYGNIPADLSKLVALESLHIEGEADFTTLPKDISNLSKLKYCYLQSSKWILLPPQFSDVKSIEFLHIRTEKWKLPERFYKLAHLKYLDLYNCEISEIPAEIAQMTHLESIILGINADRDEANTFTNLGKIKSLKSIEIDILSLPESISDCNQIEELKICADIDEKQPFHIPASFGDLKQLKKLSFQDCNMVNLPDCLFELTSLQTLSFSNCTFTALPHFISKLQHLEEISIIDCPDFTTIDNAFAKLTPLRNIYLYNLPNLKGLPPELDELSEIEEIHLSDFEHIKNVPSHWIKKIENE